MRRSLLLALGASLVLAPATFAQATLFVDDSNCPGPGTGTSGNPFCRIQAAYAAAASGDEIRVRAGTYLECVRVADSTPQKNVHLFAEACPEWRRHEAFLAQHASERAPQFAAMYLVVDLLSRIALRDS